LRGQTILRVLREGLWERGHLQIEGGAKGYGQDVEDGKNKAAGRASPILIGMNMGLHSWREDGREQHNEGKSSVGGHGRRIYKGGGKARLLKRLGKERKSQGAYRSKPSRKISCREGEGFRGAGEKREARKRCVEKSRRRGIKMRAQVGGRGEV